MFRYLIEYIQANSFLRTGYGCVLLALQVLRMCLFAVPCLANRRPPDPGLPFPRFPCLVRMARILSAVAFLALLVSLIALAAFVFRAWKPDFDNAGSADHCDKLLYVTAFVLLVLLLSLLSLALCLGCCGGCLAASFAFFQWFFRLETFVFFFYSHLTMGSPNYRSSKVRSGHQRKIQARERQIELAKKKEEANVKKWPQSKGLKGKK